MAKSKEELQKHVEEQLHIQKIALEKDFKRLEQVYKDFVSEVEKQEASNQLVSRCQGVRRDIKMAEESIQQITNLIIK